VANPVGEIRGQITAQGGVLSGVSAINAAQEVNVNGGADSVSTATGQGTVIVDRATRTILISYMTHNVNTPTLSHIHTNSGAFTGPVIINFTPTATLTTRRWGHR
jgi:hypothetical protein